MITYFWEIKSLVTFYLWHKHSTAKCFNGIQKWTININKTVSHCTPCFLLGGLKTFTIKTHWCQAKALLCKIIHLLLKHPFLLKVSVKYIFLKLTPKSVLSKPLFIINVITIITISHFREFITILIVPEINHKIWQKNNRLILLLIICC